MTSHVNLIALVETLKLASGASLSAPVVFHERLPGVPKASQTYVTEA